MNAQVLKRILLTGVAMIDDGQCNLSEDEWEGLVEVVGKIVSPELTYNKSEAAKYLHLSIRQFDRYVEKGIIPRGKKKLGATALSWTKAQLDKIKLA